MLVCILVIKRGGLWDGDAVALPGERDGGIHAQGAGINAAGGNRLAKRHRAGVSHPLTFLCRRTLGNIIVGTSRLQHGLVVSQAHYTGDRAGFADLCLFSDSASRQHEQQ